jgi:hypothetical protein
METAVKVQRAMFRTNDKDSHMHVKIIKASLYIYEYGEKKRRIEQTWRQR